MNYWSHSRSRVPLGELAERIDYGYTAPATVKNVGPKLLRITDIQDGFVNWESVPYCAYEGDLDEGHLVRSGDIVFARTGATTGKSYLIGDCPANAVFASYLIRVRPSSRIDPGYLSHFFRTQDYWNQIQKNSSGTAQAGVNATKLKRLMIPLPSYEDQRRVATILSKVDEVIRKRAETARILAKLEQTLFFDEFGDGGSDSRPWQVCALKDLCDKADDIKCGPFGTQLSRAEFQNVGVPLWGIKHVNTNFVEHTDEFVTPEKAARLADYSLLPGDIVMTRKGTVGKCAVYPAQMPLGIMHSDLLRLRINNHICEPEFLSRQMKFSLSVEAQVKSMSSGAIMAGINVTKLKQLEVQVPPIGLQRRYIEHIAAVTRTQEKLAHQLRLLGSLFASIQQAAFRVSDSTETSSVLV